MIEFNPFTRNYGTKKLREIRDAGYDAIHKLESSKRFSIIESLTIHFFNDCAMVQARFMLGRLQQKENEMPWKTISVYTRDLKVWKEYKDQFEPAEGYHKAFEYKPHDESFPTKSW
jgi:hypothetical protein